MSKTISDLTFLFSCLIVDRLSKPALKLAQNYGKCLTAFPRQVLRILLRGARKSLREYCETESGRERK